MAANGKMGNTRPPIETLRLLGGRLCLDFTNTVEPRIGKEPDDFLGNYADLVAWSQHAGVISREEADYLLSEARHQPIEATAVWERAIELREMLYRVFSSVAHETTPQAEDLEILRNSFIEMLAHAQIMPTSEGFTWEWVKREQALDCMQWPVIRSAVDLLTSTEMRRVKECPGLGDCGWLFLDTSKNGSRQWCSMEGCGSRAKMRQLYARKRAARST
jgi:predicted RNA-binding Zn ribbon-like protein